MEAALHMPNVPIHDWNALRSEFPVFEHTTYLNTCSLGALSRRTRDSVNQFLDLWQAYGASAWYKTWLGEISALRNSFERLINAQPGTCTIQHSVSAALAVIASCYDYKQRNRIITTALDFPTIPYQWLVKPDVEVVLLPSDDHIGVPIERYAEAIDERTALVATSHVFFTSGYIQPVEEITRLAHAAGAHVLIDGYQSAGQIPIDVQALDVDWYLTGGLKWLLGGPGIVELYARPELVTTLQPTTTGWFAHGQQFAFDPENWSYWDDARRFELGTPAVAAVYAGRSGMDMILEIGVDTVRQRELELVGDLTARARDAGLRMKLPSNPNEHAGIVMFPTEDPGKIVRTLAEHKIIVDYRPGHVRVSPFIYNTVEENQLIIEHLARLIR
jgi:selenocysteine lyase/cysteine desulfurase